MAWKRISLRGRILIILAALVLTTFGGSLVAMWYTQLMESLFTSVVDRDVVAQRGALELETALVMQKGFVTYYSLDGDLKWLEQLDHHHRSFEKWLTRARESTHSDSAREILDRIGSEYLSYSASRDRVIDFYKAGNRQTGAELHWDVRNQFFTIYDLCEEYKKIHQENIARAREEAGKRARLSTAVALGVIPGALVLGALLAYILFVQILKPIRQLALETDPSRTTAGEANEVKALSTRVHSLIEDVDQTQTELQLSREHLMQSEKLALVGKLAAGVAHSIRNPLTSVKMRLFSLERTLELSPIQQEDFEVISEEIRHIGIIVQNFLEFSRPPKLKVQRVSPSDVVDMALQLLRHRLESYGVVVEVKRRRRLPEVEADPEQLKEVFLNLVVNACEAMAEGGQIVVREEEGVADPLGRVAVIRVTDNGPGIPRSIHDKVFQPFFSTKAEGTGLGLSLARRILEEHDGWLSFKSRPGEGATFVITLPCVDDGSLVRS
jgi:signal transduction histidine kinase